MNQNKSLCCSHTLSKWSAIETLHLLSGFVFCLVQAFSSGHQPAWTADVGERLICLWVRKPTTGVVLSEGARKGATCVWAAQAGRRCGCFLRKPVASCCDRAALPFVAPLLHQSPSCHSQWVCVHVEGCRLQPLQAVCRQSQLCCLQCGSGDQCRL